MDISNENNPDILLKVLVVFYIIIGSSLIQPLLSKQLRHLVDNNRILQHIIGFTTLIALTVLLSEGKLDNNMIIIYSLIGYIWFIFSTKLDIHLNLIIMILLFVAYICYNSIQTLNSNIIFDKNLTNEEKNKIIKENSRMTLCAIIFILLSTILGVTLYSNKKEVQYGGGYDIVKLLLY